MTEFGWISWMALGLDWAIRIILGLHVVMRRRAVPVSLAWLSVVLFVPVFGLIVYFLVGENRLGRSRLDRYRKAGRGLQEQAAIFWRGGADDWTSDVAPYRHIAKLGVSVSGMPALRGNELKLIGEASELIESLVADIDAAKERCHIQSYIWMPQAAGRVVGEALIRAAKRGVECRVIADGAGSKRFLRGKLCSQMRHAGVQTISALPVHAGRALLVRLDLRNHRKIAVIDGRIGYIGSQNITDDSFRVSRRPKIGPWIDATVRVNGPAAQALEVVFLQDWVAESGEELPNIEQMLPDLEPPQRDGAIVQILPSGPGETPGFIHRAMLTAVYAAREEIVMTTPYFVPDEPMREALMTAASRGVNVTIVVPKHADGLLVAAAGRSHFVDLLESGVRVLRHSPGLLHAKTLCIDKHIAIIGSANFDIRSFWLNFEATLVAYDSDFASMLRFMQQGHIDKSEAVDLDQWKARSTARRLTENIARLLGPLL